MHKNRTEYIAPKLQTVDAMVDAVVDSIVDTVVDVIFNKMVGAMAGAMVYKMFDAMVDDATVRRAPSNEKRFRRKTRCGTHSTRLAGGGQFLLHLASPPPNHMSAPQI